MDKISDDLVYHCSDDNGIQALFIYIIIFIIFIPSGRLYSMIDAIFYEGCKLGLFSPIVSFQVSPQIAWIRRCIITLVAFVRLFSFVHFQMCPQSTCIRGCKITLVAFV